MALMGLSKGTPNFAPPSLRQFSALCSPFLQLVQRGGVGFGFACVARVWHTATVSADCPWIGSSCNNNSGQSRQDLTCATVSGTVSEVASMVFNMNHAQVLVLGREWRSKRVRNSSSKPFLIPNRHWFSVHIQLIWSAIGVPSVYLCSIIPILM
jgi:hypothetical protein